MTVDEMIEFLQACPGNSTCMYWNQGAWTPIVAITLDEDDGLVYLEHEVL